MADVLGALLRREHGEEVQSRCGAGGAYKTMGGRKTVVRFA